MTNNARYQYDVALSFAGQDRQVAKELVDLFRARGIRVLDDQYDAERSGKDPLIYIAELLRTKAWYCVLLISRQYPLKTWTDEERTAVQEHALRDATEYVLPVQLDDTQVPGITETVGYRDLRQHSMASIVDLIEAKLREVRVQAGPPSESHDLRSGNVPSSEDQ